MNQHNTHKPFSTLKIARLVLFKLMLLSTATLLAPSAFATASDYDDFPTCFTDINSYLPRYLSTYGYFNSHDYVDWNNEWTLGVNLPDTPLPQYMYLPKTNGLTNFKLVSIKINTLPHPKGSMNLPVIQTISCEYKDPNVKGSLSLNIKQNGKLRIGPSKPDEKDKDGNAITDRTVSYVSRSGLVTKYTQWKYDKLAPLVTEFICNEDSDKWDTQCGGWSFTRKVQNNGFWSDAFSKCDRGWPRCNHNVMPFVNWSYAIDLLATPNTTKWDGPHPQYCGAPVAMVDGWPHSGATNCRVLNTSRTYCKDAKCSAEITAVNNIIGKYQDGSGKEGMGDYTNRSCWAEPNNKIIWQNKQWDKVYETCSSLLQPSKPWPDYSHLGLYQ